MPLAVLVMNTSSVSFSPEPLTDRQRTALIVLLADEDPAVYQTVRAKLLSYGHGVREWLKPHLLSNDPVTRRRVVEIIDFLARQDSDNEFLTFCLRQAGDFDLEDAIWLLAKTQYPGINSDAYRALLDSYASTLRERLEPKLEAQQVLATINQLLYEELGFSGNEKNYYEAENSYLNLVLDRRTGNPISLCMVYLLLGRRLRLPMTGIGLPGHFVCRYQTSTVEYYVDAFNRGKLLTKANCIEYLVQSHHGFEESHLAPVTSRRMLLRICANLHQIHSQSQDDAGADRIQRYIVALAK